MYRTLDAQFWTDKKVKKLEPFGVLLLVYLITNPHSHVSGIYVLPRLYILTEGRIPADLLDTLCHTLSSEGIAHFDFENEVVFVVNMLEYQGRGEKNLRSAANQLRSIHNSPLIKDFVARYPLVSQYFRDTLSHTLSHTLSGVGTPNRNRTETDTLSQKSLLNEKEPETQTPVFPLDTGTTPGQKTAAETPPPAARKPNGSAAPVPPRNGWAPCPEIPPEMLTVWTEVREELKLTFNRQTFNTWVPPLQLVSIDPCRVWVPNSHFVAWWSEPKHVDVLRSALQLANEQEIEFGPIQISAGNNGKSK